jgi:N-acetylglucosaminyldiphosphoundecaprenol N-acetyl-beta-D-mannosaminyltransferase
VARWAAARESRYVCLCNAHSVVTARRDPRFARVLAGADLALPDGAPIAWRMRRRGHPRQQRLSGPDVMWSCCISAAAAGLPVFLLGGTPETLARLAARLRRELPGLRLAGTLAPPFRPMASAEEAAIAARINASGARLVFVGLGCPKQERWMAAQHSRVGAVMLGVGAAFDFHAGVVPRAPRWMQRAGLEWLHRLATEPRRLWRRYLVTNTLFVVYLLGEAWRARTRTSR